jgi:hypothetical protein
MSGISANTFLRGSILALLSTFSVGAWAQTTSHEIDVNRATVVYASGNDLTLRMENGAIEHFVVPGDSTVMVDNKPVSVKNLKTGTRLTQVLTTTVQEAYVTDVRTVDLKVLEVKPPYLTIASDDKIKYFRVPDGTTFTIEGKSMMLPDLKEGMKVKGTVLTTVPTTLVSSGRRVSGQSPAPKPVATPALVGVLLIEQTGEPGK